ncbi:MAG: hypothetical protein LC797_25570 [Chloroflexi bacterium]|nr:hypothetical protein [Chloroflexota bacterium]
MKVAGSRPAWYAGTGAGLFLVDRSNGDASARELGLQHTGGFRAPVVVDRANPRRLYAGTTRSGMFRSDDRGETWQACESLWQLPSTRRWTGPVPPYISRLKDLAISDDDPELLFGAIEEGWVVRSRDGGRTWDQIDDGVPHDAHTVRFVPGAPDTLVLGTQEGWLRSTDRGETWSTANVGLEERRYTPAPLVIQAARPGVLFSSVTAVGPGDWRRAAGGDAAFCRSDDAGQSWKTLTLGLPQPMAAIPRAIAVNPNNPDGYVAGATDGSLWATEDGESFQPLPARLPGIMTLTPTTT